MNASPKIFLFSARVLLSITGCAKIWSSFGAAKVLELSEPVFNFEFRHLLMAVGFIELGVAAVCLLSKNYKLTSILTLWLATNFVVYRFSLMWVGYHKPCPCLGNLTDALHISPHTADTAMKIILGYLLLGSYGTLFWLWRQMTQDLAGRATLALK